MKSQYTKKTASASEKSCAWQLDQEITQTVYYR